MHPCITVSALLLAAASLCSAAIGQSAVVTLQFPFGARSAGMGESGVCTADDASALYYNPAIIGVGSEKFSRGLVAFGFEFILPSLKLPDLWHGDIPAIVWQDPDSSRNLGALGLYVNYLNFGKNVNYDPWGRQLKEYSAGEMVIGLSYGCDVLRGSGRKSSLAFGGTLKVYRSKLIESTGTGRDGIGRGFALDASMLAITPFGLRLGGGFFNMGPPVRYLSPDMTSADPIPFILRGGLGWSHEFLRRGIRVFKPSIEASLEREVVKKFRGKAPDNFLQAFRDDLFDDPDETAEYEWDQVVRRIGGEAVFVNTFATRYGLMVDPAGERFEQHFGFGLLLCNHLIFDWAHISSPDKAPRDGQWAIGLTLFNLGSWKPDDMFWYLGPDQAKVAMKKADELWETMK